MHEPPFFRKISQIDLDEFKEVFKLAPDLLPPGLKELVDVSGFLLTGLKGLGKAVIIDAPGAVLSTTGSMLSMAGGLIGLTKNESGFVSAPGVFDAGGRASAHSIIFTRSAAPGGSYTGTMYLDGALRASGSFSGVNSAEELTIGKEYEGVGYPFTGKIWQALILSTHVDAGQASSLHSMLAAGSTYC